ncbi:hypothetical protein B484DRAFT_277301 [Ochromonadaceae sp. CCMP2298]|nr:hypothetical protein B484DRAFT_277301 [Ochromonadaceae sp. CCMP2298]
MLFKFFLFVSCAALAAGNSLRSPVPAKEVELDEGVPVSEHELHSIPVDDVKGARIAERLYKSMRDGHKASKETSKAVRAKGVNLLTPSTEVSSDGRRLSDTLESANGWDVKWNGFTQFKQRPNTDCSGVIQTIQGVVSGLCYQDDSATSWIKVGCGMIMCIPPLKRVFNPPTLYLSHVFNALSLYYNVYVTPPLYTIICIESPLYILYCVLNRFQEQQARVGLLPVRPERGGLHRHPHQQSGRYGD